MIGFFQQLVKYVVVSNDIKKKGRLQQTMYNPTYGNIYIPLFVHRTSFAKKQVYCGC